jgi:hypothetical protein
MPFDDLVEDRVLRCLERVEALLHDLGSLTADTDRQQRQQIATEMRRELEAAEKALRAMHDPR